MKVAAKVFIIIGIVLGFLCLILTIFIGTPLSFLNSTFRFMFGFYLTRLDIGLRVFIGCLCLLPIIFGFVSLAQMETKKPSIGICICVLLFCNLLGGIFLLCSSESEYVGSSGNRDKGAYRPYVPPAPPVDYYDSGSDENENLPKIVAVSGVLAGTTYPVGASGVLIGRDSVSCQIVLPSSQTKVSRIHCFVTYNPMAGMFIVNDRNSTHGTYKQGGKRISYPNPMALRSGERFYVATQENMFEVR